MTTHEGVWLDVLHDDRSGRDHGTGADRHIRANEYLSANPGIIPYGYRWLEERNAWDQ